MGLEEFKESKEFEEFNELEQFKNGALPLAAAAD
jgi:hypothetical protein